MEWIAIGAVVALAWWWWRRSRERTSERKAARERMRKGYVHPTVERYRHRTEAERAPALHAAEEARLNAWLARRTGRNRSPDPKATRTMRDMSPDAPAARRVTRGRGLWAGLLDWADVLILDTETTGLGERAEVIEVAVRHHGRTPFRRPFDADWKDLRRGGRDPRAYAETAEGRRRSRPKRRPAPHRSLRRSARGIRGRAASSPRCRARCARRRGPRRPRPMGVRDGAPSPPASRAAPRRWPPPPRWCRRGRAPGTTAAWRGCAGAACGRVAGGCSKAAPDYVQSSARCRWTYQGRGLPGIAGFQPANGARSVAFASLPRAGSPRSQEADGPSCRSPDENCA